MSRTAPRWLSSSVAFVVGLSGALVTVPSAAAAEVGAPAVRALAADSFVDSVGVATHLNYGDTSYGDRDLVERLLRESGIRHLRDGWGTGSSDVSAFVRERLGPLGVRVTMVQDPRNRADAAAQKEMVKRELLPVIAGIESLNEWDTQGPGWAATARAWTQSVAQAYRSDPATAGIPIIGPALADTNSRDNHAALGGLGEVLDYANTHDYPGDQFQMTDSIMDTVLRHAALVAPGKPVIATETGFSNGTAKAPYPAMPEAQVATVLPRLFAEHFRRGIARTFTYELLDEWPDDDFESGFGLVRHDGTPKPAFTALSRLLGLLTDRGPAFTPGSLPVRLSGGDAQTRTLLLQKRDGTYFLLLWQQERVWDGRQALAPAAVPVTLELGVAATEVLQHGLSTSEPQRRWTSATRLDVDSTADLTVLELRGPGGSAAPDADDRGRAIPAAPVAGPGLTSGPDDGGAAPAPGRPTAGVLPRSDRQVSALPWTAAHNGWGPAERDRSNGDAAAGDGGALSTGGRRFARGLGVHASSDVRLAVDGARSFSATVGVDDAGRGRGTVAFEVWADGTRLASTGRMTARSAPRTLSVDLTGRRELRLVVTDAGDGNHFDRAVWGDAVLSDLPPRRVVAPAAPGRAVTAPRRTGHVSDLSWTRSSNSLGPVERDRSNGGRAAGDGSRLRLGGRSWDKGLGTTAPSAVVLPVAGARTFSAVVGVDPVTGRRGSVRFQVWADGRKLADSGVVRGGQAPRRLVVDVAGRSTLQLVVTDGGDGRAFDRGTWADARLV